MRAVFSESSYRRQPALEEVALGTACGVGEGRGWQHPAEIAVSSQRERTAVSTARREGGRLACEAQSCGAGGLGLDATQAEERRPLPTARKLIIKASEPSGTVDWS
jgi:hypothetical protein